MSDTPTGATLPPAGQPDKDGGTAMIVVGCKLPAGLFCEIGKQGDDGHQVVRLNGANASQVIGGYGLTRVSKSFWDAWYAKHKRLDFVRNGMVFAHGDMDSAGKEAEQRANQRSGFESVDPFKTLKNSAGEVVMETDMSHFKQAQRDMQQLRRNRA